MIHCPRCDAVLAPGDRFCSDCGARVAAPVPATAAGRAEVVGCGLAGQTHQGRIHAHNEDAFVLSGPPAGGTGTVIVVCDGVSNSQTPAAASARAAQVAHDALRRAHETAQVGADAMCAAIHLAHEAVCNLPFDRQANLDPPAATLVAAWVRADGVVVGWLGDSRAYLLGPDATVLTKDHSWLATVVAEGQMTETDARRDPRAHALVSCLGTTDFARATACPDPGIAELPKAEGWLVLCSDGLWNYADSAAAIITAAGATLEADAADLCGRLVAFSLSSGGQDNVTVAAMRFPARTDNAPA